MNREKVIGYTVSIILTLIISYILTLIFEQNNTLEIFLIIQIATFTQAIVGNYLASLIE